MGLKAFLRRLLFDDERPQVGIDSSLDAYELNPSLFEQLLIEAVNLCILKAVLLFIILVASTARTTLVSPVKGADVFQSERITVVLWKLPL